MSGLTVVIPSRNRSNLEPCVAAVRKHEPGCKIVVVWDCSGGDYISFRDVEGCYLIRSALPFVYARSCNYGIAEAGDSDVVLLNDDALLTTPGGFTAMQEQARQHPEFGVIGAATNVTGQALQNPAGQGLREVPRMVCFMCVLIPRKTINAVGMLDEEFVGYGYDDDSYCLRTRRAGLKIGVYDGCFVDHGSLKSTFRGDIYPHVAFAQNRAIFVGKYGSHPL